MFRVNKRIIFLWALFSLEIIAFAVSIRTTIPASLRQATPSLTTSASANAEIPKLRLPSANVARLSLKQYAEPIPRTGHFPTPKANAGVMPRTFSSGGVHSTVELTPKVSPYLFKLVLNL